MRNTYPIRISQSPELLKIVQYAFFTRNRFIQRTINNLIYEEYLIDQFYNDQLYSTRDLILHHLIQLTFNFSGFRFMVGIIYEKDHANESIPRRKICNWKL